VTVPNFSSCQLDPPALTVRVTNQPPGRLHRIVHAINAKLNENARLIEQLDDLTTLKVEVKLNTTGGVRGAFVTFEAGRLSK